MKKLLPLLLVLLLPACAVMPGKVPPMPVHKPIRYGAEVGGYPNANSPLTGAERLIGDQNQTTVNITLVQIAQFIADDALMYNIPLFTGTITPGDCAKWQSSGVLIDAGPCNSGGGSGGTVTSVGLSMPGGFTVANSPITTNGTFNVTTTLSGPIKGTGSGFSAALASDIVGLFSGCTGTEYLGADGNCHSASGAGTVTSVGLTAPSYFTITGSPVTSAGTLAISGTIEPQNEFLATPSGTAGALGVRAIVAADLPSTVAYLSGPPSQYQTAVFSNGTTITGVGPGTSGQCYLSNGAAANPSFGPCPSAPVTSVSAGSSGVLSVSPNTGAVVADVASAPAYTVIANTTSAAAKPAQATMASLQSAMIAVNAVTYTPTLASGATNDLDPTQLPAPTQSSPSTSTTGGTLAAATYYYVITAVNAAGETTKSNEQSITTTGTTSSNTINWTAITVPASPTGYRVYRGTAAGAENVYYAVSGGPTATFTDTGAASTSGSPPASNTTGQVTTAGLVYAAANAAGSTIDGIVAGGDKQQLKLCNSAALGSDAAYIILENQSSSDTTAANRLMGSANQVLGPQQCVMMMYLAGSINRWQMGRVEDGGTPAIQPLTSGTSMTPDCSFAYVKETASATGTFTVNAPTDCTPRSGQNLILKVTSPAGGTVTYAWNPAYLAGTGTPGALPTTSTAASKEDYLDFKWDADRSGWVYLATATTF